jgi:hypothetical protein
MKPVPRPVSTSCEGRRNLREVERCPVRAFKEMSRPPKSRSIRTTRTNVGSPKGREPYGDGGFVVVVGVTPHQGVRESRKQGKGSQMIGHFKTGRYA